MLRLFDEVIILALNERTGLFQPLPDRALDFALAGALVAELIYSRRLDVHESQFKILSTEHTEDPVEDYVLDLLAKAKLNDSLSNVLQFIASHGRTLRDMIVSSFIDIAIIFKENERFCGITYKKKYFFAHELLKHKLVRRLKDIIFGNDNSRNVLKERDKVLLTLCATTKIYQNALTTYEIERAQAFFGMIQTEDPSGLGTLITKALGEVQLALIDAVGTAGY